MGRESLCDPHDYSTGFIVPPNGKIEYLTEGYSHSQWATAIMREKFQDQEEDFDDWGYFRGVSSIKYVMTELNYIRVANFASYSGKNPNEYDGLYWRYVVSTIDKLTKMCTEDYSNLNFVRYVYEWPLGANGKIESNNRIDFINKLRYKGNVPENYRTSELSQFRESLSKIIFEEISKEINR